MHHYTIEQQLQQEQASINFWGMVNAWNQRGTHRRLEENNAEIQQTNVLLEQIRRKLLTPAERAAEDAQRRAEAARRKAQAEAMRKAEAHGTAIFCLVIVATVLFLVLANCIADSLHQPKKGLSNAPEVQIEQPTPASFHYVNVESTPVPEPSASPTPEVRRAQLVKIHHHHR